MKVMSDQEFQKLKNKVRFWIGTFVVAIGGVAVLGYQISKDSNEAHTAEEIKRNVGYIQEDFRQIQDAVAQGTGTRDEYSDDIMEGRIYYKVTIPEYVNRRVLAIDGRIEEYDLSYAVLDPSGQKTAAAMKKELRRIDKQEKQREWQKKVDWGIGYIQKNFKEIQDAVAQDASTIGEWDWPQIGAQPILYQVPVPKYVERRVESINRTIGEYKLSYSVLDSSGKKTSKEMKEKLYELKRGAMTR